MNPTRKPFRADLIVFTVCCLLGSWFVGFEYGKYSVKPVVCPEPQARLMYYSKGDVKYWRDYTRSLPK